MITHLHVHSAYSLLNSTVRLDGLIAKAKACHMPALALTDQGNLFAAVQFYLGCLKAGIKPILGAQVYVVPNRHDKSSRADLETRDQLILLCRNATGWRSLTRLVSAGHLEGSHDKPRVDPELLQQHKAGLIALSAGPKGEVGRWLLANRLDLATKAARWLGDLFADEQTGAPGFYLELHRHGDPEEEELIQATVALGHKLGLPLVATNDVHFLERKDHRAHDALVCIGTSLTLLDEKRPQINNRRHFATPEEMAELFADLPESLENTLQIAKRCNFRMELGKTVLPDFQVPEGQDLSSWLKSEAAKGLNKRLALFVTPFTEPARIQEVEQQYRERLDYELDVIIQMGFPGYFLIVSDFIRWAKANGIPVGPGRGSGAGSVAAWALDITDLDPLRYQLLFERFLNPERVSMPDFDVDFCMDKRERVIHYVQQKYGRDRVAQIITFGTLQARMAIRDVGRVLQFPYGQVDRIAKLIPNILGITLQEAIDQEDRFLTLQKEEPETNELIELALALEGLPRSAGTHAAGVVMANGPLTDMVPLYLDPRSDMPVTQFNMGDVEKVGLVKFDFLGLKTLTVIDDVLKLVNQSPPIDITLIDLADPDTFKLLQSGQTRGVFQLESSGMRDILKKLAPDTFEDIIALVALYRPGPLGSGMVDDYINRKHGRVEMAYPLPQLAPILQETYGVILYQEQVMKIAQVLAGYTLGSADLLRRAMGKKKLSEMLAQREIFVRGSMANNVSNERAEFIFDLMEKFAGYGFNKSHSAAYALISYQTAWLKAHYPVEFMAATLTCDMINTDKLGQFIRECRNMRVTVLPPDVNRSQTIFTVENGCVRYALAAIKNVGEGSMEALVKARGLGPFLSLYDLCQRIAADGINRRVMENLIKAGACDSLGGSRAAMMAGLTDVIAMALKRQSDKGKGFMDLFGEIEETPPLPEIPEWSFEEKLAFEKEAIGFFITGHPLQKDAVELRDYGIDGIAHIKHRAKHRIDSSAKVRVAGVVAEKKLHRTRKGERMAFITLEDMDDQIEAVIFADLFQTCQELLEGEGTIILEGALEVSEEEPKITADRIIDLDTCRREWCQELHLRMDSLMLTNTVLERLKEIIHRHSGKTCLVTLEMRLPDRVARFAFGDAFRVTPGKNLLEEMRKLLGADNAQFRRHTTPLV
ncbi:MAG: DNA polymerase III subunit alpha [Magnetococcales bacterium]|nr:DNA polymerase III subunit alpha [Magnetococcales bacterium]MBF0438788.1 DNA polymerase III subunit alpha [Magnetococcales bacterium]